MESYKVTTYKYNNTEIKDVKIVKSKLKKKVINKISNVNIVSRDKFPKENYLCWICGVNKDDCVCNEFNNIFRNYNVEESDKKIYNCYQCKRTLENCIFILRQNLKRLTAN